MQLADASKKASEALDRSKNIAQDAATKTKELLSDATDRMAQNYGVILSIVGAAVASGVVGYFLGQRKALAKQSGILPPRPL